MTTRGAWWFAVRDLGGTRRDVAQLIPLCLGLLTVAGLLITGFTERAETAERTELERSLCLWIGTKKYAAPISRQAEEHVRAAGATTLPITFLRREWCRLDADDVRSGAPLWGRLVEADDRRLIDLVAWRDGNGPTMPQGEGLWVTPTLIRELGGDPEHPPKELRVRSALTGRAVVVAVTAVTQDDYLPPGQLTFAVSRTTLEALERAAPRRDSAAAETGPVPVEWAALERLPPEKQRPLREAFRTFELAYPPDPCYVNADPFWMLRTLGGAGKPESDWHNIVTIGLPNVLRSAGFVVPDSFRTVRQTFEAREEPPPSPRNVQALAVYPNSAAEMRASAAAARAIDLLVDDVTLNRVGEFEQSTERRRANHDWAVAAIGVVVGIVLLVLCTLRSSYRSASWGLLRAMGLSDGTLAVLLVGEAVLLWLLGLILGVAFAWAVGFLWIRVLSSQPDVPVIWSWPAVVRLAVGTGGLMLVAVAISYFVNFRKSPAESLSKLGG